MTNQIDTIAEGIAVGLDMLGFAIVFALVIAYGISFVLWLCDCKGHQSKERHL